MARPYLIGLTISVVWVLIAWAGGAIGHPSGVMAAFLAALYGGYVSLAQGWLEKNPVVPIQPRAVPAIGAVMMAMALAKALVG